MSKAALTYWTIESLVDMNDSELDLMIEWCGENNSYPEVLGAAIAEKNSRHAETCEDMSTCEWSPLVLDL